MIWVVCNVTNGFHDLKVVVNIYIQKINDVVRGNRRLTVRELAEEIGIATGLCHDILTKKLNIHRIAEDFFPRLMTEQQKENRVHVCRLLLKQVNAKDHNLR